MPSLQKFALSSPIIASALLLSPMGTPANAAAPPLPKSGGQSAAQTRALADWQALTDLQAQLRETEKSDPKAAITQYKKYWEDHPDLNPAVSAQLCTIVARIYHSGLKDDAMALATCDWAIAQHKTSRERIRPILYKAQLLMELKRTDEVEALIEPNWTLMLISGPMYTGPMLDLYRAAMKQQLKQAQTEDRIKDSFRKLPVYLGDEEWSAGVALYPALIQEMSDRHQYDPAFRWAKLRFMLCPYTPRAVSRAVVGLMNVVKASDQPLQSAGAAAKTMAVPNAKPAPSAKRVFGQLTPDTSADAGTAEGDSGPATLPSSFTTLAQKLRDSPLPEDAFDRTQLQERLTTLGKANEQQRIERITLLLVCGYNRQAMDEALQYAKEMPGSPNGPKQVARVLKATDLDVKRANAYLEFKSSGKGTDPIPAFLQQYPEDEKGPSAPG